VRQARILILVENEPVPHDRHVWNQSRALVRAGHDVTVICPKGEEQDRDSFERLDGVDIHRYEPYRGAGGIAGYVREYGSSLWHMGRISRRLARERPFDVVHACSPPDFLLLAALPLRRRGARFIFDHHDLTPELFLTRFGPGPLHRVTLVAERLAFRLADVVLSVNESYRRVAIERGARRPDEVKVVRTGPDLACFRPTAPDPSLKRGRRFLLCYVGVMSAQDGVDHALRALAELRRRREDWHAVFMGDGDVLDELRHLRDQLGLADATEFTGWVEQETIVRVLSTSDVCLAPDPKNALNDLSSMVKISEYMAMSRPIVSYDLAESCFAAGDAAVYAPSNDVAAFAGLIDQLLDDQERRAAMGAVGRERVEQVLAWEHQERSLLAAYEQALAGSAGAAGSRASRRREGEARVGVGS
jgi:glycosyltransferase involved in cell wall biosynthesis